VFEAATLRDLARVPSDVWSGMIEPEHWTDLALEGRFQMTSDSLDPRIGARRLRRVTGGLFTLGAVAFAVAATVLSSTFDWPDILREPARVVLPEYADGGTSLTWTWFAVAWTYGILLVPVLLLPWVLDRRDDPVMGVATFVGAISVVVSVAGFLRWVFVVPSLADDFVTGDATTQAAVAAAWTAQHQYGGALLGEHLGELLVIAWSTTVSIVVLRHRLLPAWVGWSGLVVSAAYLLNQGDILSTAIPGFPVFDLAGAIGSTGWGLWVAALGIALLVREPRSDRIAVARA
jgi:hypothetical protein